mgnify:CR=1 FL=1
MNKKYYVTETITIGKYYNKKDAQKLIDKRIAEAPENSYDIVEYWGGING